MSVSPELMTELLGLPEPERVDLVQRLLEASVRERSPTISMMTSARSSTRRFKGWRLILAPDVSDQRPPSSPSFANAARGERLSH